MVKGLGRVLSYHLKAPPTDDIFDRFWYAYTIRMQASVLLDLRRIRVLSGKSNPSVDLRSGLELDTISENCGRSVSRMWGLGKAVFHSALRPLTLV